jgi:hypothetical protein
MSNRQWPIPTILVRFQVGVVYSIDLLSSVRSGHLVHRRYKVGYVNTK